MEGWVKIHRKLLENALWLDKPYSKGQAWIDLILHANHKDGKILIGSALTPIKKGSFITSDIKLSNRWGWSRGKVRSFIEMLEREKMITRDTTTKYTALSIINYEHYQLDKKEIAKEAPTDTKLLDELWELYPNKKGKAKAYISLKKLVKLHSKEELERCIKVYADSVKGTETRFIKHGSTFFNGAYKDYMQAKQGGLVWIKRENTETGIIENVLVDSQTLKEV